MRDWSRAYVLELASAVHRQFSVRGSRPCCSNREVLDPIHDMNKSLRPVSQCFCHSPLRPHLRQASASRGARHLTLAKDSAGTWPTGEAAPPIDVSGNGGSPPTYGGSGDNGDGAGARCQLSCCLCSLNVSADRSAAWAAGPQMKHIN